MSRSTSDFPGTAKNHFTQEKEHYFTQQNALKKEKCEFL